MELTDNWRLVVAIIIATLVRINKGECPEPKTNRWTEVNLPMNSFKAEFWCLDNNGTGTILHQTNKKDPNHKKVILTCDPIKNEWNGPLPLCFPACLQPRGDKLIVNGNSAGGGRYYLLDTEVKFSCSERNLFVLNGSSVARCGEDGTFDHQPECVATCNGGEILTEELAAHISVTFDRPQSPIKDRYLPGTLAQFSCTESSSYLEGAKSTICKPNGSWMNLVVNNKIPTCVPSCKNIPDLSDKGMSVKFELSYLKSLPTGYPLGAATLFDCSDPHHDLIGKSWLLCQPSGTKAEWNGAIPYCEATCDPIDLSGKSSSLLAEFDPQVIAGRLKTSLNGRYANKTKITFSCRNTYNKRGEPYELVGISSLTCQNGKWSSDQLPDCVATCDGRQVLQMNDDQRVKISLSRKESSVYSGRYISGTSVVFSCSDPRFQLRGATSAVCNDSGSWGNFIKPSCVPTCDGFPSEEGTRAVSYYSPPDPTLMAAPDGRYSAGSTAVFRCTDDHHDLIGPLSLTCLQDNQWKAQWNGTEPRCEATCEAMAFDDIEESFVLISLQYDQPAIESRTRPSLSGRFSANTKAHFSCESNTSNVVYEMVGESTSVCQENGQWTITQEPICVPTCGSESLLTAEEQTFMKISIAGELFTDAKTRQIRFREGARATFTCRDGDMQLFGIGETECLSDGSWKDFERLTCKKTCLELPPSEIMNLDVTYNELHLNKLTGRRYSFGTKATLSCKDSAALLIGPEEIYCSDDGSWDDISDRQCDATCGEPILEGLSKYADAMVIPSFSRPSLVKPVGRYSIGTTVAFKCDKDGLKLNGDPVLTCLSSGNWNGTFATCNMVGRSTSSGETSGYTYNWVWICLGLIVALVLSIIGLFCYSRRKKKQKSKKRGIIPYNEPITERANRKLLSADDQPELLNASQITDNDERLRYEENIVPMISVDLQEEPVYIEVETGPLNNQQSIKDEDAEIDESQQDYLTKMNAHLTEEELDSEKASTIYAQIQKPKNPQAVAKSSSALQDDEENGSEKNKGGDQPYDTL